MGTPPTLLDGFCGLTERVPIFSTGMKPGIPIPRQEGEKCKVVDYGTFFLMRNEFAKLIFSAGFRNGHWPN